MRRLSLFALAIAFGGLAIGGSFGARAEPARHRTRAQAQHERLAHLNETLVKKRSFLDVGNVVPVGSMNAYMADATFYNWTQPGGTWRRSDFGAELLPGPHDLPGFNPASPW